MMQGVNLLPWREQRRSRQRRTAFIISGALVASSLGLIGGVWWIQSKEIKYQAARNQFMQQAIVRVDAELREVRDIQKRKDELLARMEVIRRLQSARTRLVTEMTELATLTPEGVFFSTMSKTPAGVNLTGVAQSSARISSLMENLTGTASFDRPDLDIINVGPTQRFNLWVSPAQPK